MGVTIAVLLIALPCTLKVSTCYAYDMRHHGLLRKVLQVHPSMSFSLGPFEPFQNFHVHLQPTSTSSDKDNYVFAEQATTMACNLLSSYYCMPPFRCWSLSTVWPLCMQYFFSLARFPLHTCQSFPVFPFLLYIEHHPISIAPGQCFRIEHGQVALLLLLGVRYHQISGDKL